MEGTNTSAASKVIVQCTDSSNVLDLFEPRLSARTPLRNLHWKSPSRPLRSIPALNIEVTREDRSTRGAQPGQRRHQIPGLRETPYVKIYLLRCDNKEIYKEEARRQIKQWVKENSDAKENRASKRQEQHDAAEWIIVHVVLPDTPAATQPRFSKHISLEASESTDSINSKSKWTGKSPSTILDKLRADFASSSKSQHNRVYQVRITDPAKPQGVLTSAELEEQWEDLVEGLKSCILRSFDVRVRQYEDDIQERESQRTLPGWNFCTFFILKEGLARGFENVGLLQDALAIYDELELGLDVIVKEQAHDDDTDSSNALLPYSAYLKNLIRIAIEPSETVMPEDDTLWEKLNIAELIDAEKSRFPFELEKRKYRDLILSNQVSALDFRIYLFTVKMEILLRQARNPSPSKSNNKSIPLDIDTVAQLTESALEFINLASRELRRDLYQAWGGRLEGSELTTQKTVIGNIVTSWVWAATMQILSFALPASGVNLDEVDEIDKFRRFLITLEAVKTAPKIGAISDADLSTQNTDSISSSAPTAIRSLSPQKRPNGGLEVQDNTITSFQANAHLLQRKLAFWSAQLLLLARSQLEVLSITDLIFTGHKSTDEVGAEQVILGTANPDSSFTVDENSVVPISPTRGIPEAFNSLAPRALRQGLRSKVGAYELYMSLSKSAYLLLITASSQKEAQLTLMKIAQAAYQAGEVQTAALCLERILDSRAHHPLNSSIRGVVLPLYAKCLKSLEQPNKYSQCILSCLHNLQSLSPGIVQHYLDELASASHTADKVVFKELNIFKIVQMSPAVSHYLDKDGFHLSLSIQSQFPGSFTTTKAATLCLRSLTPDNPQQLWLSTNGPVTVSPIATEVSFGCNSNVKGWYELERVDLHLGNFLFQHDFRAVTPDRTAINRSVVSPTSAISLIQLYPRADAFSLDIQCSHVINLNEPRKLTLNVDLGSNNIQKCLIRLRAATAGLRLHLHDIKTKQASSLKVAVIREEGITAIEITDFQTSRLTELELPFSMESQNEALVAIKAETEYVGEHGTFILYQNFSVDIILPISVKVQDFYRDGYLMSKFTIASATLVPIQLLQCEFAKDKDLWFDAEHNLHKPITIFPRQPATWVARLPKRPPKDHPKSAALVLDITFQRFDDMVKESLSSALINHVAGRVDHNYLHLLKGYLLSQVANLWTEQDLELAALTREMMIWDTELFDWETGLAGIEPIKRTQILEILDEWHKNQDSVTLPATNIPTRKLKLVVDQPPWPPIVSADLRVSNGNQIPEVITLDQPIFAELVIQVQYGGDATIFEASTDTMLVYDLAAPSDHWLIGGKKRGWILPSRKSVRIPITLLPQRVGKVLAPGIDIKCRRRDLKTPTGWVDIPIEINNKMLSQNIAVIGGARSTTVELGIEDSSGTGIALQAGGQSWLISHRFLDS